MCRGRGSGHGHRAALSDVNVGFHKCHRLAGNQNPARSPAMLPTQHNLPLGRASALPRQVTWRALPVLLVQQALAQRGYPARR